MWPKPQALTGVERDALPGEERRRGKRAKFTVGAQEIVSNRIVFFAQDTSGCVDQAAAVFYQRGRGGQDGPLLGGELVDRGGLVSPFQVRVAPQRAKTATRSIAQRAVRVRRAAWPIRPLRTRARSRASASRRRGFSRRRRRSSRRSSRRGAA